MGVCFNMKGCLVAFGLTLFFVNYVFSEWVPPPPGIPQQHYVGIPTLSPEYKERERKKCLKKLEKLEASTPPPCPEGGYSCEPESLQRPDIKEALARFASIFVKNKTFLYEEEAQCYYRLEDQEVRFKRVGGGRPAYKINAKVHLMGPGCGNIPKRYECKEVEVFPKWIKMENECKVEAMPRT